MPPKPRAAGARPELHRVRLGAVVTYLMRRQEFLYEGDVNTKD